MRSSMKLVILDSDTLGYDLDFSVFEKFGELETYRFSSEDEVIERAQDASVCISNKVQYTKELIEKLPKLKLICLTSTGTNTADLKACRELGIEVCNIVGYSTESVLQLTYSLMFYLLAPLKFYDNYTKKGDYIDDFAFSHYKHTWNELNGKTLGIVGLGTIGSRVAAIGSAFGARVCYYSTSGMNSNSSYERVGFDELLSRSDIISIHAPLNTNTKGLFGLNEFEKMKKDSIILNLGRGPIINENELIDALNMGLIGKAGIDVLAVEPMIKNHPIMKLKDSGRLIMTPHVGWASIESRNRMVNEVVLNVESYLNGTKRNVVN